MGKKIAISLKVLSGLLFLAGLVLYLFRGPMLEALLSSQLTRYGIPVHSLKVEDVSLNSIVIRDLSLGVADELRTEKVYSTWNLNELLQGVFRTVEISGLRLQVDLSGEKPPLGSLQKLVEGEDDSEAGQIPQIQIFDAQLDLHTSVDDITVQLDGNIDQESTGGQMIALKYQATANQGTAKGNLEATLEPSGNLRGTVTFTEGGLSLAEVNVSGFSGTGSFILIDDQPPSFDAALALSNISLPGSGLNNDAFETAQLFVQVEQSDASIKGDLGAVGKVPAISFSAMIENYRVQPRVAVDAIVEADAETSAWLLTGLPKPAAGSASVVWNVSGEIPALNAIDNNWQSWMQHSRLHSDAGLILNGLEYAEKISALSGNVKLSTDIADNLVKANIAENSYIEVSGLDLEWASQLGLPAEITKHFKPDTQLRVVTNNENTANIKLGSSQDGVEMDLVTDIKINADKAQASVSAVAAVTLNPQNQLTTFNVNDIAVTSSDLYYADTRLSQLNMTGNIQGSAAAWTGELDLEANTKRLRIDVFDARQAKAVLPLQLEFDNQNWQFFLRKPGRIRFGKLAAVESVRVQGPVTLRIPKAEIVLNTNTQDFALEHRVTILPDKFNLQINPAADTTIDMTVRPGRILLIGDKESNKNYKGKSAISSAGITLPQYKIQLDNIATTIALGSAGSGHLADFSVGQLRHLATTPYFAPLSLKGRVKLRGKQLLFNAGGEIPDTQLLKVSGTHSLKSGTGSLTLTLIPQTFTPDILQPSAILPGLAPLENVTGKISASNHINWSKEGMNSGGDFDLQNISFTLNGTPVTGLSAVLQLTDLLSPQSPPQQKISVAHIDPGVPMENLDITYQIQAMESPQVAIDKAGLSMLGGTLSTGNFLIDPAASHNNMIIKVADLDLAALFELIEVDGLAGGGRLDGTIPIAFDDGLVSIQNGVLAANKPGILRFESEKVSEILAGRFDDVDLLLEALTEFHYSELILKLNNSVNNDLVATLSLLGNNPNVLKGRLFRLNINLESNVGKILDAVAQAYGLSNKAIQRAFRLR